MQINVIIAPKLIAPWHFKKQNMQDKAIQQQLLKPHCIQSSRVLVPAGTSKSTSRCHGIQAETSVIAYVANSVTL
jgi:hypothetical protein